MNNTRRITATFLFLTLLFASPAVAGSAKVTAAEYGADWPFTVGEGVISCEPYGNSHIITFTAGGKTYSVNGTARNFDQERGYADLEEIWKQSPEDKELKIPIGGIIEKGLSLCK